MLEKAPVYGGTSAKSGGAFWVPNNFRLKERGIEDPKASLLAYCAAYSYPHLFDSNSTTLGLGEDVYKLLEAFYDNARSEEHTSELQSLMRISYAVFWLKNTNN